MATFGNWEEEGVKSAPSMCACGQHMQLNQYRLMDAIGQGTFGIVQMAYNVVDDTHYAMKIVSKRKLGQRAGTFGRVPPVRRGRNAVGVSPLQRVYREIAVLKKLDHPNVVRLVEVLDDAGADHLYMVFELVRGGRVLDVLPTDTPLAEDDARTHFRDLLLGIEYLHYQRIIHRDIKPDNLLLSADGRLQIADLGVCSEFEGVDAALRSTVGTPAFWSPEAVAGGVFSGRAADVWAMGVTLYALVYGRLPFPANTLPALYTAIRLHPLRFPTSPPISPALQRLIQRMLDRNPAHRITIPNIRTEAWLQRGPALPTPADNCRHLVAVSDDEVAHAATTMPPRLDTLILIKRMLSQHSFHNPRRAKQQQ